MNKQQNTGGVAALIITVFFIVSFIFILFVWPAYGVRGPEDVRDPAVILPAVAGAPILLVWLGINIPIAATLGVVVLAWKDRLQERPTGLARFAFVVGLASALFFFIVGVLRITGYPYLAGQYAADPAAAVSAYTSYLVADNAFDRAAIFASGLWLVLVNWAALKAGDLQQLLRYFGMVTGVAAIFGALVPSLAPVALLLYIFWFLWFGASQMRNRDSASGPYPSAVSSSNRPN